MSDAVLRFCNGEAAARRDLPVLPERGFRDFVAGGAAAGARVAALFGMPANAGAIRLVAVLADGRTGGLSAASALVGDRYASLTPDCPAVHLFEREIAEQWGVRPEGHPWLKPVRFRRSFVPGRDAWGRAPDDPILPGVTDFFRVEGEEIHEVAVGPVHAGVIEPGHFRFQCHGEDVYHLEIALGYQHRGAERAIEEGPAARTPHLAETLAGDTSVGHATAHAQVLEALSGRAAPARAEVLRGIALELERLANHVGDLGALAGDVGYLPTQSFCGRLRGDFLNLTARLCGSRFGRGLVRPGGVAFDLDPSRATAIAEGLERTMRDTAGAVGLLWDSPSVIARFEDTGVVDRATAVALGLVGPAARASGLEVDARYEFPSGIFRLSQVPVAAWHTGDVFARAWVRWLEIQYSAAFLRDQLASLPDGSLRNGTGPNAAGSLAVSLVEGWRGEIAHVAMTDDAGRIERYKVVDPSFHNWTGLALALRGQPVSDFPLCNKSFNLSYCGHDL